MSNREHLTGLSRKIFELNTDMNPTTNATSDLRKTQYKKLELKLINYFLPEHVRK